MSLNKQMTDLMNAVRSKSGLSGKLTIAQATDAVWTIKGDGDSNSGVVLPEGITVTAADVKAGVFFIAADGTKAAGSMPIKGDKKITLSTEKQLLDDGYYSSIEIPGTPFANLTSQQIELATSDAGKVLESEYFITGSGSFKQGSMKDHGTLEITPSESVQEYPGGYYGSITVEAVEPGNNGVVLPEGITVTAADVKKGVFYIDSAGVKQEGTMDNHGVKEVELQEIPSSLPEGYYERIDLPAADDLTNLTAGNIRKGVNINGIDGAFTGDATATAADIALGKTAGVNGTMITGEMEVGSSSDDALEFIECSHYQAAQDGEPLYPKILTLCDWSLAGENAENMASGIYYPENLIVGAQDTWTFVRSDNQYLVYVEKSADDTTGRIVLFDASAEAVVAATGYMELENIWDVWQNEQGCTLYLPDEAENGYFDGYMPYYFCNIVEWGNGNMFVISDAGSPGVNGLYVRGSGCNEFFSAGCYDCWVNDDGTAAIYHIEDWITDEEENNIFGLLIKFNGSAMYELPTADWDYETVITSAAQFAGYTWRAVDGETPLPMLYDGEPELSEPTPEEWWGYLMQRELADCIEVSGGAYYEDDDEDLTGVYCLSMTEAASVIYSNGNKSVRIYFSNNELGVSLVTSSSIPCFSLYIDYDPQKSIKEQILGTRKWMGLIDDATITLTDKSYYYWKKTDTLKTGNVPTVLKPRVGEIYSADTTIRVQKMYDGAAYPITSDGLVFYAPLEYDSIDAISNTEGEENNVSYTEYLGKKCAYFNGSFCSWGTDNISMPNGSSAFSFFVMFAPASSGSDWIFVMGASKNEDRSVGASIQLLNNNIASNVNGSDFSTDVEATVNKWHTATLVGINGAIKLYLDGQQIQIFSKNFSNTFDLIYMGEDLGQSSRHSINAYMAHAAIYNRELSADEVAEIHSALMEDVVQ